MWVNPCALFLFIVLTVTNFQTFEIVLIGFDSNNRPVCGSCNGYRSRNIGYIKLLRIQAWRTTHSCVEHDYDPTWSVVGYPGKGVSIISYQSNWQVSKLTQIVYVSVIFLFTTFKTQDIVSGTISDNSQMIPFQMKHHMSVLRILSDLNTI